MGFAMACSHSHARPSAGGLTSNSSNSKNRPESGGIAPEQCNSKAVSGAELAAQLGTRPPAPLDPYPILRLGGLNLEHLHEQFGFTVFQGKFGFSVRLRCTAGHWNINWKKCCTTLVTTLRLPTCWGSRSSKCRLASSCVKTFGCKHSSS